MMIYDLHFKLSSSPLAFFLLILVLVFNKLQAQQISRIDQVLNQADSLVQDLASQAALNQQKTCESLASCTLENCLRHPCRPQSRDEIRSLQCSEVVAANSSCSSSCNRLLLSTNSSYVRVSPLASLENDYELRKSICAQKPLNDKLRQGWQSSSQLSNGWFFFGAAEGFLFVYPGRDYEGDNDCKLYDPRIRPWYINSLAVVKSLYVLLDNSPSMSLQIGSLSQNSHLEVGKGIVNELLKTLADGDQVAISKINIDQLIGKPVSVSLENIHMSYEQPEIQGLQDAVSSTKADGAQADLGQGLAGALKFFSSSNSSSNLKVVMILTDGKFAGSLNVTALETIIQQLNQEKVVVFFYRIGYWDSNDVKLQQLKPRLNMSFETVTDSDNPLWRIRSYFDYVAWLRFTSVNKAPVWVPLYPDSAGLGNITTAAFPAFDANQRLIGVAALDLDTTKLVSELGKSAVDAAVSKRSPPPSTLTQPDLQLIQIATNGSTSCSHQGQITPVCPIRDTATPLASFMCCGQNCSLLSNERRSKKSTNSAAAIGASAGGASLALVLLASLIFYLYSRKRDQKKQEADEARARAAAAEEELQLKKWITPETLAPKLASTNSLVFQQKAPEITPYDESPTTTR